MSHDSLKPGEWCRCIICLAVDSFPKCKTNWKGYMLRVSSGLSSRTLNSISYNTRCSFLTHPLRREGQVCIM